MFIITSSYNRLSILKYDFTRLVAVYCYLVMSTETITFLLFIIPLLLQHKDKQF